MPADPRRDPVGAVLDRIQDTILDFERRSGRRLVTDPQTARELAERIYDAAWEYDPSELEPGHPVAGGDHPPLATP
jgi:hypothetical protein